MSEAAAMAPQGMSCCCVRCGNVQTGMGAEQIGESLEDFQPAFSPWHGT